MIAPIGCEKLITVGMPFVYEIGKKDLLTKMPRWDYTNSVGWYDKGPTGILAEAEVLAIQDGVGIFVLPQARHAALSPNMTQQYLIPLDRSNKLRGFVYNPLQWTWDGFFQPDGGWESYMPIKDLKICSCGAEGYAKRTNTPITGHGVMCEKWEQNPYQRR